MFMFVFKSKAQSSITPFSNLPDGQVYGWIYGGYPGGGTVEDDQVHAAPPSGMYTVGVYLVVSLHGDLGDDIYPIIDSSTGDIDDTWDYAAATAPYPGENFTLTYGWECDYSDGINTYYCGETIVE